MDIKKTLKEALGSMVDDENLTIVSDAITKKLEEAKNAARSEVEDEVREEFARRYENDKGILVEAMDRMLTDAINEELNEFAEDRRDVLKQRNNLIEATNKAKKHYQVKLKEHIGKVNKFIAQQLHEEISEFSEDRKSISEQRLKLAKMIVENKKSYRNKLNSHLGVLREFIVRQLREELEEFAQDRRLLQEQRIKVAKQLREERLQYKQQFNGRIKMLEGFVLKQLSDEMREFKEDKDALIESRVKLVTEGKKKLDDTRRQFIKRASTVVETTIEDILRKEMSQFRKDIAESRKNNFGRRLFEAFASEYMTSYLSEGSEVKKLMVQLTETKKKLDETSKQLKSKDKILTEAQSKVRRAEDRANRTKVLNELLSPLARDKRAVMEELLGDVKTDNLRQAYNKYLPSVLNEDASRVNNRRSRTSLNERRMDVNTSRVSVDGNRRNRVVETAEAEQNGDENIVEIQTLLKNAGLAK